MSPTRRRRPASKRPSAVMILAAYPRRLAAERAARSLVRERLLACATVTPGSRAFYQWEGRLRAASSTLLWGKTTRAKVEDAIRAIRKTHPDQVPEILVLSILDGYGPYLEWLAGEVK